MEKNGYIFGDAKNLPRLKWLWWYSKASCFVSVKFVLMALSLFQESNALR